MSKSLFKMVIISPCLSWVFADAAVKIIDFGLSKKYASDTFLHDTVGTVYTMAPELLKGGYTNLVDCWSLGVILFMLLSR